MDFADLGSKGFEVGKGLKCFFGRKEPRVDGAVNYFGVKSGNNCLHFEEIKKRRSLYVLGRDVTYNMVENPAKRALVGRFEFLRLPQGNTLSWIRVKLEPFLSNMPWVMVLVNGWVVFHFLYIEDC